jgi:hypothetical protein
MNWLNAIKIQDIQSSGWLLARKSDQMLASLNPLVQISASHKASSFPCLPPKFHPWEQCSTNVLFSPSCSLHLLCTHRQTMLSCVVERISSGLLPRGSVQNQVMHGQSGWTRHQGMKMFIYSLSKILTRQLES